MSRTETAVTHIDMDGRLQLSSEAAHIDCVWVPTEQVAFLQAQVPGKRRADWLQALPYALEEKLAQPVESLHFVVLHREASGTTWVAVVEKARMQRWLDELAAQGVSQAELVPDCFRVPIAENGQAWQIWPAGEGGRCLVRTGRYSGLAGDVDWLEDVWTLAQSQVSAEAPAQMSAHPAVQTSAQPSVQPSAQTPSQAPVLNRQTLSALPEVTLGEVKPFSLRQGAFRVVREKGGVWRIWLTPMVLVTLLFATLLTDRLLQAKRLEAQADAYQQQTRALFQKMFPDVQRIVNIRAQTKTRLNRLAEAPETAQFNDLLQATEQVLKPLLEAKQVTLQTLRWQNRQLQLSLTAADGTLLQQLAEQLNSRYRAEFKLSEAAADQTQGVLYVRAP